MNQRRKPGSPREAAAAQEMRDQEVLRANKELTAYFRGQRTEREARAALKVIKAFVRDRERSDAGTRAPLPGAKVAKKPTALRNRSSAGASGAQPQSTKRPTPRKKSKAAKKSIESQATAPLQATKSVEPTVDG